MFRRFHPYRMGYVRNQETLFAFGPRPKDMRKFVLFRLRKQALADEQFTVFTRVHADGSILTLAGKQPVAGGGASIAATL